MRYLFYLIVFNLFSPAFAGSYDDFFVAIRTDDVVGIRQLLNRGFDPNTPDPQGTHPLMLALRAGSLKAAQELATHVATKPDERNADDETPLMLAALQGHTELARALMARDADVNKTGWTPLHYAATNGHVDIMRLLLDAHAYIDAESPNGTTPLMMAAYYGTPAAVQLLLAAGADPALKNQQGLTAIDFAARANRSDLAALIASAVRQRSGRGRW